MTAEQRAERIIACRKSLAEYQTAGLEVGVELMTMRLAEMGITGEALENENWDTLKEGVAA